MEEIPTMSGFLRDLEELEAGIAEIKAGLAEVKEEHQRFEEEFSYVKEELPHILEQTRASYRRRYVPLPFQSRLS